MLKVKKVLAIVLCAVTLSLGLGVVSRPTEVKACSLPVRPGSVTPWPGYYLSTAIGDHYDYNVDMVQTFLWNLSQESGFDANYIGGFDPHGDMNKFMDGYFGSMTKSGVIYYQQKHGLNPDGIVGSATWNSMMSHPHL